MTKRSSIGDRIKALRKKNSFSQALVAEKLFISQAAYSLIENSQNGIAVDHIINLSKLYEVTTDFILKGDTFLIRIDPSNGFIPLIRAQAHAGFVKNFHEENSFEVSDWYRIPGFNPAIEQKLFEVTGQSMSPTLLNGDVIICQAQPKIDNILDGSLILLVTEGGILIKRIRLDNNNEYLLLESDNEDEKEQSKKINKSDIYQAMVVRGKISSVILPHHQITSKGKIQKMEEAIDFLKKELFILNKKLSNLNK
ncbi:helix-turn-helix protein [Gillisia sp. Hel_I_86]|uniref:XRE family transcriptional regulator n=1 Tax=Gillisia sp. Hel_I_86 TaxID=1249981 RepID=UPI0011999278|nr:LexA family transcriptional regulator [Gillisia sp. Hel_I_86]TVZ27454.1 helix-turn-helix protein [Gillisia sp. Hel_I_86]